MKKFIIIYNFWLEVTFWNIFIKIAEIKYMSVYTLRVCIVKFIVIIKRLRSARLV
jgi:hypothetical protein